MGGSPPGRDGAREMIRTFLAAQGSSVGKSLLEDDQIESSKAIMGIDRQLIAGVPAVSRGQPAATLSAADQKMIASARSMGAPYASAAMTPRSSLDP